MYREDRGDKTFTGISIQSLKQAVIAFREFLDQPDNGAAKFKAKNAVAVLHGHDPDVLEAAMKEADSPYSLHYRVYKEKCYREDYGDDRVCVCGHPYHRHFDGYEDNAAVGCKYCRCCDFREDKEATRIDREVRAKREAND